MRCSREKLRNLLNSKRISSVVDLLFSHIYLLFVSSSSHKIMAPATRSNKSSSTRPAFIDDDDDDDEEFGTTQPFILDDLYTPEEKEKKLLLGLLQTPIRELEWLLAKIIFGIILIVMAALLLQLLTGINLKPAGILNYLVFLLAGGFCFSAFGIFIGFLCRTQASARTLGVIFYLPLLMPSALAEFSSSLNVVAPLLPSYQFYQPIKSILLEGSSTFEFFPALFALALLGLITSYLSYLLMKKRWLM